MPWYSILGLVGTIVGLIGVGWAVIKYWHNLAVKAVADNLKRELGPVRAEVTNNGGSSLKDQVVDMRNEMHQAFKEVRTHLNRQDLRIDRLYDRLGE